MVITDEFTKLDARLANWRIWLRTGPRYGQCGSLEGYFRSPQIWWPPGPKPPTADDADAREVELAVCTLVMRFHLFLRLKYVAYGLSDSDIARILRKELRIRVSYRDIPDLDVEAKTALQIAVKAPLVIRRNRVVDKVRAMGCRPFVDLMID